MPADLLTQPRPLARPVEYGEVKLAPTTELAALAELSEASDEGTRLLTICRAAVAIRDEDAERDRIRALQRAALAADAPTLPKRR